MTVLAISFLAACSNSAQAAGLKQNQLDISRLGQLQYGCALVRHLNQTHQSKDDWENVLDPFSNIDPTFAIAGLFHSIAPPSDSKNGLPKIGARIIKDAESLNLEDFVKAMDVAMAKCKSLKDNTNQAESSKQNQPDISQSGQRQYGCALAKHLNQTHQSKDNWKGYLDSGGAINQLFAIVGLFRGIVRSSDNKNGLPKIGARILKYAQRLKIKDLPEALDAAVAKCKSLKKSTNKE